MKIYTKKGDKGLTSLIGGDRVHKNHIRIEAYGTSDELNSWIGLLGSLEILKSKSVLIREIQNELFKIGSVLAMAPGSTFSLPELSSDLTQLLESSIDRMESDLPELKNFIIPGGNQGTSYAHIARCVCRRFERRIVDLGREEEVSEEILQFVNRLSDWLFVLSRWVSLESGSEEILWKPRG